MDAEEAGLTTQFAPRRAQHAIGMPRARGLMFYTLTQIILAMVCFSIAPALAQTSDSGSARPRRFVAVQASKVQRGELKIFLSGLGTASAVSSVIVSARVDGQLMKLDAREGEMVKAGQLLAQIDPRAFLAQLAQAEGQMTRDQTLLQTAQRDLTRYQGLLAQDAISRQQVETQAGLVGQYAGVVTSDQAAFDSARLQLSYSRVVAPISGRLGLRQVDVGSIVHTTDANGIIAINRIDPIEVVFALPETQLAAVQQSWRKGKKLLVEAWDGEQKNLLKTGYLVSIDNQVDLTTGTVKLKAKFDNGDASLFPNQFVNVRLLAETRLDDTLAPAAAVQRGRAGAFVYVVMANQTVTQRLVALGAENDMQVEVRQGLAPGEMVVTDGIDQLHEGTRVKVSVPSSLRKGSPVGGGTSRFPDRSS